MQPRARRRTGPGAGGTSGPLARAGFIRLYALSPSVNLVDMDSLWAHLQEVGEDPDFWDRDGENFKRYCHVNGLDEQAQARLARGHK